MPRTICNGVSYFWSEEGQGPPVILAHPLFADAEYWDAIAPSLVKHHRVIRFDFRCHGRSVGTTTRFSLEDLADDLGDLVAETSAKGAAVVGAGMGGHAALRLAIRRPEVVGKLVLMNVDAGAESAVGKGIYTLVYRLATQFEPDQRPDMIPRSAWLNPLLVRFMFSPRTRKDQAEMVKGWLKKFTAQDPTATPFAALAMANRTSVKADLGKVTAPTLILDGADDRQNPGGRGAALAKGIGSSRREVVADAGHMVAVEKPQEVLAILEPFLRG